MRTLLFATLLIGLAGQAQAAAIAGPGDCAQSDPLSLRMGPVDDEGEKAKEPATSISARLLGPARHRFLPTTVGAGGGGGPQLGPPSPGAAARPGACDAAGSVCGGALQPNPNPPAPTRRAATRSRPSPPPVLIDPNPDVGGKE